jgi:hypothetical protein
MATRGRSAEVHARTTFYYSNGTGIYSPHTIIPIGRDTYILHNSGGLVKQDKLMARPSSALNSTTKFHDFIQRLVS